MGVVIPSPGLTCGTKTTWPLAGFICGTKTAGLSAFLARGAEFDPPAFFFLFCEVSAFPDFPFLFLFLPWLEVQDRLVGEAREEMGDRMGGSKSGDICLLFLE